MSWSLGGTCLVSLSRKSVCVCLHVFTLEAMIWIPYDKLNKFYSYFMATVVGIVNGVGLGILYVMETNPIRVS